MQQEYDLTYGDLNPTLLFACKNLCTAPIDRHAHDYTEMFIILSGQQTIVWNDKPFELGIGDVLICNPGDYHRELVSNPMDPALRFIVGFSHYQFRDMPADRIVLPEGPVLRLSSPARKNVISLCFDMVAEGYTGQMGQYFMQKAYLIQLLIWIMRDALGTSLEKGEQSRYAFDSYGKTYAVKQIRRYLEEHYPEKISLDQIARNMYLSSVYISKIFKEETGETPINYLIKIRLEKAREYLENPGGESIKEIAEKVGYDDAYHFSKLFKKYYGEAPAFYKKHA